MEETKSYIRVGIDYFKIITTTDQFGIDRTKLKKWSKAEIIEDHGRKSVDEVGRFNDFAIVPAHKEYTRSVNDAYNLYHPFSFYPDEPMLGTPYKGIYWTSVLMREIFGNQLKLGFQYMKVLYERPIQTLPVLVLVSEIRQTGKSTFLNWLNAIFGENMSMINPESISSQFNGDYAASNIVGIDETIIERKAAVEKIKSLATAKYITYNMKFVDPVKIPFFGKIIMATNNEVDFMRIDQKEVRFWIRKLHLPRIKNHKILEDCIKEIPAFLHYLENMPPIDYTKDRMVFTADQIENEQLAAIKTSSRSSLYKELHEYFTDWFSNNKHSTLTKVTPKDIKERWFRHNNNISISYIRKVIKEEFNIEASIPQAYRAFDEESMIWKTGRVFEFPRELFVNDQVPF